MKGFAFSLADNTSLVENPDGYFLLSAVPLRILRINRPLFSLINHVLQGGNLADFAPDNPVMNSAHLLRGVLSLVSMGYLKLDAIAEMEDCPRVSVIIPVKDRPDDLLECLQSLSGLDYPRESIEIIVVDDASASDVSQVVAAHDVRVIRQNRPRGPAACRNIGAENSGGEILAFLDADCIAGERWLRELVPFFQTVTVGAVGGFVAGYYKTGQLDRYEAVSSSLNMGSRILLEGRIDSSFYVPTASMLVKKEVFTSTGGFNEEMRVGEDVDFCWRMRSRGHSLLYVPYGSVAHKHRSRLDKMLQRRFEYGTSEAVLYSAYRDKRKNFIVSAFAALSFLALTLAILLWNPYPLCAIPPLFGLDLFRKSAALKRSRMVLPHRQIFYSALRSYYSFSYFAFFHLVRYYLVLFIGFGFLWYPVWVFGGLAIIGASIVDFYVKKPKLLYPSFLFFYLLEHIVYQSGVFWGCLKRRYFGSYLLSFKRA